MLCAKVVIIPVVNARLVANSINVTVASIVTIVYLFHLFVLARRNFMMMVLWYVKPVIILVLHATVESR